MAIQQFSRSLPMALYRTLDAVMPRFRRIFNEFGITEQQWRVLRVLLDAPERRLTELAALTLIPAPSLVGVVDRLESAGLVARRRSASDRRIVYVAMTEAGKDLLSRLLPRVATAYADLKQSVDEQTWNSVLSGLDRIASGKREAGR
jgi:homoprotocatechuate degradation regulator HpaR